MRSARTHGFVVVSCVLAVAATVTAAQPKVPLRDTPIEAYGVLCQEVPAEAAQDKPSVEGRQLTYKGVVVSDEPRVAGPLTVWLTITRDAQTGIASYTGRMEIRPAALKGEAGWTGTFGGDLDKSMALDDPAKLGPQIVHRRMISVTHEHGGPFGAARLPEPREVRRLLHGSGSLQGLELIFDFRVNEGTRPAASALPPGCNMDFELWKGAIVVHK